MLVKPSEEGQVSMPVRKTLSPSLNWKQLIFPSDGGWIREDSSDYDAWARLVKDEKWSYQRLLPFFRKSEHCHSADLDANEHGYNGPVYTQSVSSTGRHYPLREGMKAAWELSGVVQKADANSGAPQGMGELVENRNNGARQLASTIYPLAGVQVMTQKMVNRIFVQTREGIQVATGVQVTDDRIHLAREEVILSAGAYRTPQLLMLSGIGPGKELAKHGIKQTLDAPFVGQNLHDHMAVSQWWKLRNPEVGLALGSPNFSNPTFAKGTPMDWVITQPVPHNELKMALAKDEGNIDDLHPLLTPPRSCLEFVVVYAAANAANPAIPMDGSHITTTVAGLQPASRGTVTLASTDPATAPLIDPDYNATEADRYVMRTGLKQMLEVMMDNKEGQAMVEKETIAKGWTALTLYASDMELDKRIRKCGK